MNKYNMYLIIFISTIFVKSLILFWVTQKHIILMLVLKATYLWIVPFILIKLGLQNIEAEVFAKRNKKKKLVHIQTENSTFQF